MQTNLKIKHKSSTKNKSAYVDK